MSKDKIHEVGVVLELRLKVVKRCLVKQWLPNNKDFKFVKAWEKDIGEQIIMAIGNASNELGETETKTLVKDTIDLALEDLENINKSDEDKFDRKLDKIINLLGITTRI